MKNHIDKLIYFDEENYQRSKMLFEKEIVPALDQVKAAYDKLQIGEFEDETYRTVLQKGISELERKYDLVIENELSKMKLPAVSFGMSEYLNDKAPFEKVQLAWQKVLGILETNNLSYFKCNLDL